LADASIRKEHESFHDWIESRPVALFDAATYAAYRQVRYPEKVSSVITRRGAFKISLQSYDKSLCKPAGRGQDLLPRYNRLVLRVLKQDDVDLDGFTITATRVGSQVGKDNVEYVTVDVRGAPVGLSVQREVFLFDPFNVPFESIAIDSSPYIDLASPMRVKYREILEFL
jgi:hypothetical protein